MSVEVHAFGVTALGEPVHCYHLRSGRGLTAQVLDYGCTLRALTVPGPGGPVDVCLGYDTLGEYESQDACLGAVVGRFANRIAAGRFTLGGKVYTLARNNGDNHLHGGLRGFDRHVWSAQVDDSAVTFSRCSPHGEEGYPGNLDAAVAYRLTDDALEITYSATTDADTVVSLTNHAYFNLTAGGSVLDHTLQISATRFAEVTGDCLPTGRLLPVEGTPLDFRAPKPVGRDLNAPCQQITNVSGYDHNFVLDAPGLTAPAARLTAPDGALTMEVYTDRPGVQLYTANFLTPRPGKAGAQYTPRCALCLETQAFPDAPNQPTFPSPVLRPGERFHTVTTFRFPQLK